MEEQREKWPEQVFEIVWHQHDRDQWIAEVKDTLTDQHRQVCSLEELRQFLQAQLWTEEPWTPG